MPRLLLIKPKMIGDTLLARPAIAAARRDCPDWEIDIVVRTGSEGVLEGLEFGRVLATVPPDDESRSRSPGWWGWCRNLRKVNYDIACDLTGTERGHFILLASRARRKTTAPAAADLHQKWLWSRLLPTLALPDWESLHAVERDLRVLASLIPIDAGSPSLGFPASRPPAGLPASYAVIHPASRVAGKIWPESNWLSIARFLADTCGHVVLSSGRSDAEIELSHRLARAAPGRTTVTEGRWAWTELASALRAARVFAGSDTAVAHLAAAVDTPSVVIWGPSHEHIWAPWSDRAWLVVEDSIVPSAATRKRPPSPGAMRRSTAANSTATVESALRIALGAVPVS